jgi:hypothetical protein
MGIFSKIWKGVKKTFKKIFKPIKKVFASVGKFMNKIGIVGQIAMMFIPIPGLGALMSGLGSMGTKALGWLSQAGTIGAGAAKVIGSAFKFAKGIAKPFVEISKGVTGFIKDVSKYVVNKIPGVNIASAPSSIFGKGGAWQTASETITNSFSTFKGDMVSAASMDISDLLDNTDKLVTPKMDLTPDPKFPTDVEATYSDALDFGKAAPDSAIIKDLKELDVFKAPESLLTDTNTVTASVTTQSSSPYADTASKALDMREASQAYRDTIAKDGAGVLQETIEEGTEGFFNKMKNSILDPYKKFAGDPLGTTGEAAANFVSDQLSPQALYNRFTAPDMPEAAKRFQGMYISPERAADKYSMFSQMTQQPVFEQSTEFADMYSMGLGRGGLTAMPNGVLGYGGSDMYREMMAKLGVPATGSVTGY